MKSAPGSAIAALLLAVGAGCTAGPVDVASISPDSLAAGLVAHWTFDDAAGATAHDSSGNGRDGTIVGNGWGWADGRFAGALQLAGIDQVTAGSGFGFPQATANYSVSAWLNIAASDIEPPIAAVLSTEIPWGVGPPGGWSLNVDPPAPGPGVAGNYQFTFWFGQGGPSEFVTAECACFAFDKWTHLAAVVDATSDSLTFYVDGRARQQVPVPRGIWPAPGPLFMGRYPMYGVGPGPVPVRQLAGALDDVAIYSRALVPEEVAQLSRAPAPDPI
jgi:hypothetical protein